MFKINISKAIKEIKDSKAKTVLIQLPDGLKPKATEIANQLQDYANIYIWSGTCFGACDIPKANVDLLLHFGHTKWLFYKQKL